MKQIKFIEIEEVEGKPRIKQIWGIAKARDFQKRCNHERKNKNL